MIPKLSTWTENEFVDTREMLFSANCQFQISHRGQCNPEVVHDESCWLLRHSAMPWPFRASAPSCKRGRLYEAVYEKAVLEW